MNEARSYRTPEAFRAALNRRLKNESEGMQRPQGRLLQLVVFERFLDRLHHGFGERVVLKGGLALELRLSRARTTKDIDLRMEGRDDDLLRVLRASGQLDLDDYLKYEVRPDPRNPVLDAAGMKYQGVRFRVVGMLAGKRLGDPFGLDIAYAEPTAGQFDMVRGLDVLDFIGIPAMDHRVYPIESHIAEKLHAYTLPRLHENSRVKDLPDLALLSTIRSLDAVELRNALRRTFEHRGTHELPVRLPAPPSNWSGVYEELAARDGLPWESLDDVWKAAAELLEQVLGSGAGVWNPETKQWTSK